MSPVLVTFVVPTRNLGPFPQPPTQLKQMTALRNEKSVMNRLMFSTRVGTAINRGNLILLK